MNKKKLVAIFVCAMLAVSVALAGCSTRQAASVADDHAADVAGTYLCDSVFLNGEEVNGLSDKVILEENGKGICVYEDEEYELRWELNDTAIAWKDDAGDKFKGTVDFDKGIITGTYSIDYQGGEHEDLDYTFEKVQ